MTDSQSTGWRDSEGQTWHCRVTVADMRRIRDLLAVDIVAGDPWLERCLADVYFLVDLLYVVCKPQADAAGIDQEAFAGRLAGDVLAAAKRALVAGIIGFFPDAATREALTAVAAKWSEAARRLLEELRATAEKTELPRELVAALATLGPPSTSSPASPASTPPG